MQTGILSFCSHLLFNIAIFKINVLKTLISNENLTFKCTIYFNQHGFCLLGNKLEEMLVCSEHYLDLKTVEQTTTDTSTIGDNTDCHYNTDGERTDSNYSTEGERKHSDIITRDERTQSTESLKCHSDSNYSSGSSNSSESLCLSNI